MTAAEPMSAGFSGFGFYTFSHKCVYTFLSHQVNVMEKLLTDLLVM